MLPRGPLWLFFRQTVAKHAQLFVFERNLQHPIDKVIVIVELDQCLLEQSRSMPGGPLRQISPAWMATSAYCPLVPGLSFGPRKSTEFS